MKCSKALALRGIEDTSALGLSAAMHATRRRWHSLAGEDFGNQQNPRVLETLARFLKRVGGQPMAFAPSLHVKMVHRIVLLRTWLGFVPLAIANSGSFTLTRVVIRPVAVFEVSFPV